MRTINKFVSLLILFSLLGGMAVSCKPKKCANFTDERKNHSVKYNRKGLVKKKH
jgi:hypothetical protein